jgi:2-acylglycerol O-acyltransferase 2
MVPHGIFPASLFAFYLMHMRLPFNRIKAATASAVLYFPYWRQFAHWLGNIPADRREIKAALEKGFSVTTYMDGIHGMFAGESQEVERVLVKEKKGLARMAVLTGAPLVPCYSFGATRLVKTVADPFGILLAISRTLRISLVVPLGRYYLPIPVRTPCTVAFGKPIAVRCMAEKDEGFAAEVEKVHATLLAETVALFERNKALCGFGGVELLVQ